MTLYTICPVLYYLKADFDWLYKQSKSWLVNLHSYSQANSILLIVFSFLILTILIDLSLKIS